jgi:Flp pilus assembly secretin CpaC
MALLRSSRGVFALCALALATFGVPASTFAADIEVLLDQAKLVKMPERVNTIVIGNPAIADATVQAGGWMVITGKGYGTTNLIALDRSGGVLLEKTVEVQGPQSGVVTVYKGVDRESYSCTPLCERRLTLGDGQPYFEANTAQGAARNALATGAGQSK